MRPEKEEPCPPKPWRRRMKKVETPKNVKELPLAVVKQMAALATSGFGLVAALAWNNVIQEFINNYIKPYVGIGSGLVSLLIYAIIVTALAVLVTLQLSKIQQRLENLQKIEKKSEKK